MKKVLGALWQIILILGATYFILDAFFKRPPTQEFGILGFIALILVIVYIIKLRSK
jgi:hypothetical protein